MKTYMEEFSESYKQFYDSLFEYLLDEIQSHIYDLTDQLPILNNNVVKKEWIEVNLNEHPKRFREQLSICVSGMTEEILNKIISIWSYDLFKNNKE
tara:strand:- start:156 stop:443 length:288 start_codon:yes stop_codon:yes gene_type:complete